MMRPTPFSIAAASLLVAAAATITTATAAPTVVSAAAPAFELIVLSNETAQKYGGFCLDGSPPGFYWRKPATGGSSSKWIWHNRGGAWCFTAQDCVTRSKSDLGSSTYYNPDLTKTVNIYSGLMDSVVAGSAFADYNVVFAMYCDGTSATSDRTEPLTVGNTTLWFRGKRGLLAMLSELEARAGLLSTATDFIYTGTSAGGLAVYATQALVHSYFSAPALRFVAVPDSGFFLDALDVRGQRSFWASFEGAVGPGLWNASGGTDAACIAAHQNTPTSCFFAQYIVPYVSNHLFIANSMADEWSVNNVLALPCTPGTNCNATQMAAFYAFQSQLEGNITAARATHGTRDGLFLTGCLQHGQTCSDGDWFECQIGGVSQNSTFVSWYTGEGAPAGWVAVDHPWPKGERCENVAHGWC